MITFNLGSGDSVINNGVVYGDMVMKKNADKQEKSKKHTKEVYDVPQKSYEYDIAFSYASEQEPFVLRVAKLLDEMGIKVFVKPFEEQRFLAKDLHRETYKIYALSCRFIACFISKEYWAKEIPRHEFSVGINRIKKEKRICMIPVMMDETRPASLDPSIVYIDVASDDLTEMDVAGKMEAILLEDQRMQGQ